MVLSLILGDYEPIYRPAMAMCCLPYLGQLASHYRALDTEGVTIAPNMFVAVSGPSGSGKSMATKMRDRLLSEMLKDDYEEELKEKESRREVQRKANAKEKPDLYLARKHYINDCTQASLLQRLDALDDEEEMMLMTFAEADALKKMMSNNYGPGTAFFRNGWDGEATSLTRITTGTTTVRTRFNLLVSATDKVLMDYIYSEKNAENGFAQRFIPVTMPTGVLDAPKQNLLPEDERAMLMNTLNALYKKNKALAKKTELVEMPGILAAVKTFREMVKDSYLAGEITQADEMLSHRIGQIMIRVGIPFVALTGAETMEVVDFARWVGMTTWTMQRQLIGKRVEEDLHYSMRLRTTRKTTLTMELYGSLPTEFTKDELQAKRKAKGMVGAADMTLSRWKQNNLVEKIEKNRYRKVG